MDLGWCSRITEVCKMSDMCECFRVSSLPMVADAIKLFRLLMDVFFMRLMAFPNAAFSMSILV